MKAAAFCVAALLIAAPLALADGVVRSALLMRKCFPQGSRLACSMLKGCFRYLTQAAQLTYQGTKDFSQSGSPAGAQHL